MSATKLIRLISVFLHLFIASAFFIDAVNLDILFLSDKICRNDFDGAVSRCSYTAQATDGHSHQSKFFNQLETLNAPSARHLLSDTDSPTISPEIERAQVATQRFVEARRIAFSVSHKPLSNFYVLRKLLI